MTFNDLELIQPLVDAVASKGYTTPTPIQEQAIPIVLTGTDLLGCAQTGTGKTAAFALPILQRLYEMPATQERQKKIQCLILTPTRELAIQIHESFTEYGANLKLRSIVIFGGVSQVRQVEGLKRGVDILIATPGRLLDLIGQGFIKLADVSILVLDEADRMLDMGFVHDVKRIVKLVPVKRQTLFFSATMPSAIQQLSKTILHNPQYVEVTPESTTAERVIQQLYYVDKPDKKKLLVHLLTNQDIRSLLVFSRTKHGADKIVKDLHRANIGAEAIHGNKSQNARQRALANFKSGHARVLVATDIAARGIDVEALSHVINYDLPDVPETYVHRIGRTGRAGAGGVAITFCDGEELDELKQIQKTINMQIPVVAEHPFPASGTLQIRPPKNKDVVGRPGAVRGGTGNSSKSSNSKPNTRTAKRW